MRYAVIENIYVKTFFLHFWPLIQLRALFKMVQVGSLKSTSIDSVGVRHVVVDFQIFFVLAFQAWRRIVNSSTSSRPWFTFLLQDRRFKQKQISNAWYVWHMHDSFFIYLISFILMSVSKPYSLSLIEIITVHKNK